MDDVTTRGYCFLCFGPDHIYELHNLLRTMKKVGNKLPISVITSEEDQNLLNVSLFDSIINFDFSHIFYNEQLTTFEHYCLIPRLLFNKYLPYDENIVTDIDMLCQYNPSHIWNIVSNIDQPVVMCGMKNDLSWHWGYISEVNDYLGKEVDSCTGGFFYINKRHKDIDNYFNLLHEIYKNYDNYKLKRWFRGGRVDEPIFAIANNLMGYQVLEHLEHPIMAYNYNSDQIIPSKNQTYPYNKELETYIPFIHMFRPHNENYFTILNKILNYDYGSSNISSVL